MRDHREEAEKKLLLGLLYDLEDKVGHLGYGLEALDDRFSNDCREEPDRDEVWWPITGDMLSIRPTWNREIVDEQDHRGVVRFRATDRVRKTILPRFLAGSAVYYRIVIHIPRVAEPFMTLAALPARKLVALCDEVKAIAAAEGKEITFDRLRISVVRDGPEPESMFFLTRDTSKGAAGRAADPVRRSPLEPAAHTVRQGSRLPRQGRSGLLQAAGRGRVPPRCESLAGRPAGIHSDGRVPGYRSDGGVRGSLEFRLEIAMGCQ